MTIAMTQGVLNALNPKHLEAWQRRRAHRVARPPQSKAAFVRAVSQLHAAFPDNVKVN